MIYANSFPKNPGDLLWENLQLVEGWWATGSCELAIWPIFCSWPFSVGWQLGNKRDVASHQVAPNDWQVFFITMNPRQIKLLEQLPLWTCVVSIVRNRTYKRCNVSLTANLNRMPIRTDMSISWFVKISTVPKPTWIINVSAMQDPYLVAADEVEMSCADTIPALQLFIGYRGCKLSWFLSHWWSMFSSRAKTPWGYGWRAWFGQWVAISCPTKRWHFGSHTRGQTDLPWFINRHWVMMSSDLF